MSFPPDLYHTLVDAHFDPPAARSYIFTLGTIDSLAQSCVDDYSVLITSASLLVGQTCGKSIGLDRCLTRLRRLLSYYGVNFSIAYGDKWFLSIISSC
jgi:hypothetical protein